MEKLRLNLKSCRVVVTEDSRTNSVVVSVHPSHQFDVEAVSSNALLVTLDEGERLKED